VHVQYQTGAYGMHPAINALARYLRMREPNVRTVTTFHDLLPAYLFPKAGPVRDAVTFELARSSSAVVAITERDYARLQYLRLSHLALIPIGSNITTTLPRGYDRAAWRAQLGVAPDEWLVCHFGFINDRKGVDTLVRALAQLDRTRLLLVGGQTGASDPTNAATLERVRALIAELHLDSRVTWTGYVTPDMVTAHLRAADLCVLPFREGATYQHGTLMAALAHALPIVTTRLPATPLPDSPLPPLRDGDNCILVPPDDPVAIAQAIRRAAVSPELCTRISRGACDLAQHFTWDKIVEQHLELYSRVKGPR
jgi:glycosyltransferase involved in cell wall biosynthesis